MKALIMGITGQDGSYLAEFLLSRGYEIHGTARHTARDQTERINHIINRICLHQCDMLDQLTLINLIEAIRPDEIYNLAGPVPSDDGWEQPMLTSQVNGSGALRLFEAVRLVHPRSRIFQATSAEIFGNPVESPQTEQTPFAPRTPFAVAKLYAHWMAARYREHYGLHICCGILYDHDSPRRGAEYISRRIVDAAAGAKLGLQNRLNLPGPDFPRDWGFAGDYVRSFWMMLQHPQPDDYIIATGKTHSLGDFCRVAFAAVDCDWHKYITIENNHAPRKRGILCGSTEHVRHNLLWEAEVSFEDMVTMMVTEAVKRFQSQALVHSTATANRLTEVFSK